MLYHWSDNYLLKQPSFKILYVELSWQEWDGIGRPSCLEAGVPIHSSKRQVTHWLAIEDMLVSDAVQTYLSRLVTKPMMSSFTVCP